MGRKCTGRPFTVNKKGALLALNQVSVKSQGESVLNVTIIIIYYNYSSVHTQYPLQDSLALLPAPYYAEYKHAQWKQRYMYAISRYGQ